MTKLLFGLFAVLAGAATVIQSSLNAALSARMGLGPALVVNTVVVLIGTLLLCLARGTQINFFPPGVHWTLYLGGLCGFLIIGSLAVVFPKIGAAVAIALVVLGQGGAALVVDHFGLLGMPKEPMTLARVGGMALVAAGVVLIRAA